MLIKLFGISIYDALLGPDRNIDELCKLINKPRSKKEAKIYYKIDSEDVNYKPENENDVSEVEIQNILAHYKRLGKNEEKYLESFDNIASQYNDVQLRIICKFLPLNVRAVLEEKSPKYQKVMSFNSKVTDKLRKGKHNEEANGTSEKLLKTVNTKETLLSKPVVIPNAVNLQNTKKLTKPKPVEEKKEEEDPLKQIEREINTYVKNENGFVQTQQTKTTKQEENLRIAETEEKTEEVESKPAPKRGRGRPRKNPLPEEDARMKKEYARICREQSTTDNPVFYENLIQNYIYKGPVEEWYIRIKVKMEDNYRLFNRLVPVKGQITDIGCGFGPLCYMLSQLSEEREITGIDYDEDKIAVAQQGWLRTPRLQFVCANALEYPLPESDAFILNDILHYMNYEHQRTLLLRCMERLRPEGKLIVRDGNAANTRKHRLTRFTELLSTGIFSFNKTTEQLCFTSEAQIRSIAQEGGMQLEILPNDRYTSNTIYIFQKNKPEHE